MPESLDEFARTDLLLDALAERRPVHVGDPDMDAMATLLEDWRDNLRWPPASALVSAEEAVDALRTGLADRRRGRRGLATIGSVAAALLVMSGFGAMVVEARPGTTLYGLHAMFFDQPRVNEKHQALLSAKADLAKVQESIDRGEWDQARNQLTEVSSLVQSIDDPASKQELTNQLKLLDARVRSRNPNATLPPPANTPPGWSTPTTPVPTAAATPSGASAGPSVTPSPSQSWSKHRHHGESWTPSAVTPNNP
ncbi:hypothetical protein H5P32_09280 [Mycobacterium paraseoulense]|uniref:Anti-sigma-D factor RsdA sigma factor binding region domain-containing protein n=1 Tax=Mycobacterium paraseoulense TaxID=590652 RepID=A0A1X0I3K2_9MYCO|nr:hypothetical protein [Mycobacterium paraseoulense]ORB33967.1 hypothetical protein BST39_24920 [Mycobacterium paraseoulense]